MTAKDSFNSFVSLCLQARGAEALTTAKKIRCKGLSTKNQKIVNGFLKRFSVQKSRARGSSALSRLIGIYENYWHEVLFNPSRKSAIEKQLGNRIRRWLKDERRVELDTESLEKTVIRLKKEVEAMGFHCITGTVSPLQELEIWRKQKAVTYSVKLPENKQRVRTFLMSNFLTKGWIAYASVGLHYPGGWAAKEGLYCNTHAYDLRSEKFRVSYLGHEAQHYSDYKQFPKLGQIDLEYRAKLTEFALSNRTTRKMFQVFSSRASYNRKSPHAFSYYCVMRNLTRKLKGHDDFQRLSSEIHMVKSEAINQAAIKLLSEHSVALKRRGARKVRSYIS